jgi:signal transduction histidine kinase
VAAIRPSSQGRSFLSGETVEILFGGADRWNYTRPDRLLFSHRMDEGPWSEPRPLAPATFIDLAAGTHRFEVRAIDCNGNASVTAAAAEFDLFLPWYREPRVVTIAGVATAAALFFAWLAWNRHRQLRRSHAEIERLVNLRTEQLAEANSQLLHSQKMNALGTLAAGVAHDFNNILSIVKGSAQIIERNLSDPDKIRTRVERIRTVVDQGAAVVQSLLGFSRTPEKTLARCSANEIVEETIRLLGDRFLHEIEIDFDWAPGLPETVCAKALVQQMILNIVLNAADAMNGGGRIAIRTGEVAHLPEDLVLEPQPADAFVFISIRDHGSGIAPEVLPRIFEPFFTTKDLSQRRGTGLGLSMVYQIASENRLGLHVESTVNVGTTFILYLPVLPTAQAGDVLNQPPIRQS